MINLRIHILIFFSMYSMTTSSQTIDDALRYSLLSPTTTARSAGVAGAFGPLGADLSVSSTNPAGIAEFRKSEYTISLGLPLRKTSSTIGGQTTETNDVNVKLDNLAAVFFYNPRSFDIKSVNIAIGVNTLADFTQQISYDGETPGTIVNRFLERAEGLTPDELDPFEAGPAFDAGAIYNFDNGTSYESDFVTLQEVNRKTQDIQRTGSLNEIFINFASNIKNKISYGLTLGFPFLNFTEEKIYRESDLGNSIDFFDEISYRENLTTSGVGVNIKAGIIYKFTNRLRLGAAIHSPSWYFLQDEFSTAVNYAFTANGASEQFDASSGLSEFDYRLRTPWRVHAGLGYLYMSGDIRGFISGDVEYVDYSSNSFNLTANSTNPIDQFQQDDLNNEINSIMTSAVNVRVGTELAYKKGRVRLGVGLENSPFVDQSMWDIDPTITAGLGFRANNVYVDLALIMQSSSSIYSPYRLLDSNLNQQVNNDLTANRIVLTFGSKM